MVVTMMMWWQWRDGKKCEGRNGNAININGGMQENKLKIFDVGGAASIRRHVLLHKPKWW